MDTIEYFTCEYIFYHVKKIRLKKDTLCVNISIINTSKSLLCYVIVLL